jgi:2-dehydro-3-deoxyphosphogalactonate aldolase
MKREIIAILRGIKPNEVLAVAHSIAESGITQIEVPMNSPDVFDSIKLLCDEFRDDIQIGAGTVTNTKQVETLSDIGGVRFIVSPNFDSEVVEATKKMGMMSFPGVITPTECFSALKSGADGLKFFPATLLGEANLSALYMVGGVGPENFLSWFDAGATGFGIGSGLYKAGDSAEIVYEKAKAIVLSYDKAK